MNSSLLSFTSQLEDYVFSVASQVVESTDRQGQDQLVDLLISIDTSSTPVDGTMIAEDLLLSVSTLYSGLATNANESPRKRRKGPHNEKRRRLLEASIVGYQLSIDSTFGYLSRVDVLLARLEKAVTTNLRRAFLLDRYQSSRNRYLLVLVRAQALQAREQAKLNRYQ